MFRPPRMQTVSDWADENRILVSESSSTTGPWRTDRAPYQKEIMDSFTQPGIWKIVVKASSQVGKSELVLNMMGRAIHLEPGPMLYVQPTDDMAEDYSKRRIAPMIAACPVLRSKVYAAKGRDSGNTITMKTFPGGSVALTGANSPSELASRPIRYLFLDETDRFPASAGTEGNPIELAERRTETFRHNRKVVLTSSPGIKGKSEIEKQFQSGTQEEWQTQCPHCGHWSFIRFDNIIFEKEQRGERSWKIWDVRWKCPKCRNETTEHDTKRSPAKWVARNPGALEEGIRSFWLNAFMSPWSDWKDICQKFLMAKDDPEELKVFKNTILAELWEIGDKSGVPEKLYARREHYDAEVPTGVLVLTMGIDTQDNRLEYEVVGWNRDEESWGISRGVIPGRPDSPGVWEEVDALLDKEWKMANGMKMRILGTFIDSGGHFFEAIYRECAKRINKRIWPIKGEGGEKPYVRPMKKASKGEGMKFIIGVDSGKEAILYASGIEEPGPRYMHFPIDYRCGYDEEYFHGLISERQVIHRRGGRATISWEVIHERNEPLDMRNYARGVYRYFNWRFDEIERMLGGENTKKPITKAQAQKKKRRTVISGGIKV
ncbi:MAG: phage terminase large subunit family protein [Clostridia bacterium]|nr:phage terminase large subunit family protein [Clostridia bacterium]